MGSSHEGLFTFMIISRSIIIEWEIFQTKFAEKIKTNIFCSVTFSQKSCRLWGKVKNVVERGRPDTTVQQAHAPCVLDIYKTTDTNSGYVILIAFPLQLWLYQRISVLRYTYFACLASSTVRAHWERNGVPLSYRLKENKCLSYIYKTFHFMWLSVYVKIISLYITNNTKNTNILVVLLVLLVM